MPLILPIYHCETWEIKPFDNKEDAENFITVNKLNLNGVCYLVPYLANGQVAFLKPADTYDRLRIIGAANYFIHHTLKRQLKDWFNSLLPTKDFVPHVNDLEGDAILLEENGFIICYERGDTRAGKEFLELFNEERKALIEKIKTASTNDESELNPAEFIERIAILAMKLDIKAGTTTFVRKDKEGKQAVYRVVFKDGKVINNIANLSTAEKENKRSKCVRVHYNKTESSHLFSFLKDWVKWTVFAAVTALGVGLITAVFLSTPVAGVIAGLTFLGMSFFAIYKASKENQNTIEFGTPEFEIIKPKLSILEQLKTIVWMAWVYLLGKSNMQGAHSHALPDTHPLPSDTALPPTTTGLPSVPSQETLEPLPVHPVGTQTVESERPSSTKSSFLSPLPPLSFFRRKSPNPGPKNTNNHPLLVSASKPT